MTYNVYRGIFSRREVRLCVGIIILRLECPAVHRSDHPVKLFQQRMVNVESALGIYYIRLSAFKHIHPAYLIRQRKKIFKVPYMRRIGHIYHMVCHSYRFKSVLSGALTVFLYS